MLIRLVTLAVTLATLTLAGCGSSPPKQRPAETKASSSASESGSTGTGEPAATETQSASGPLTPNECVEVTSAHLDILVASNAEQAGPPAEKLKAYNPPPSVVEAIDHFVEVGGIQFDDPDANKHTEELKAWVSEVCP